MARGIQHETKPFATHFVVGRARAANGQQTSEIDVAQRCTIALQKAMKAAWIV